MASPIVSGRAELAEILALASRQAGPVRLFQPKKAGAKRTEPGLFPSSRGKYGELIREMLDTMFVEVVLRPRMVRLTDFGVESLLRNTPQGKRERLIDESSPLYRESLLRAWKKFSTRGEEASLSRSVEKHFGHWDPGAGGDDELREFRELLAQEMADSWSSARSEETRKYLAHFLEILGAEPLGRPGELVDFTGMKHISSVPLFKGDAVRIVEPGWIFPREPAPLLLIKAEVTSTTTTS